MGTGGNLQTAIFNRVGIYTTSSVSFIGFFHSVIIFWNVKIMMPKALDGRRSSRINYTFVPGEQRLELYCIYYRIANLFHVGEKGFPFTHVNNTVHFYFTVSITLIAVMSYHLLLDC